MDNNNNEILETEMMYAPSDDEHSTAAGAETFTAEEKNKKRSFRHGLRKFRGSTFSRIMYDKGVLVFLLSFFIPAGIMTFAMAQSGIHPFGNNQILVVDLWHQYYPFFRVVREKLLTGGSFLYSWENGLGSNFLSLISYYAMSPLNWLSIFFDADHVRDALTFFLIAKIGFAGAFFSLFLRYTYKRTDLSVCIFSVMYALSSFTLGYYWNVMWFDTIALFPLVMLGIVAICREGKWKCFTFSLALSLISNYYIAFFTCIFSVFMFAAAGIIEFRGIKSWLHKFRIMLRSSVIGIALAAFMLLPAYYGLETTYSSDGKSMIEKLKDIFARDTVYYEKWTDILANTVSYTEPTKVEGLPNIACGMLALVLFGVFLFSFRIKIREKISSMAMLTVIIVSCNINKLNYIWHGFHFTNQIPYRFAFIFSFVLAASAYRAYDILMKHGIKVYQLILMLFVPGGVFYLNYVVKGTKFTISGALWSSLVITGAFWLIFLAAKVFPFKKKTVRNTAMSIALAAAVFSEFVSNAEIGVRTVGNTTYNDYPAKYEASEALINSAKAAENSSFMRMEMTTTYTLNDSALYGYYGISQFSSAANVSVTKLMKRFGLYAHEAGNRYYYRTATPVFNSMFGIKYLISRYGTLNSTEPALEFSGEAESAYMYKNKYPLSPGYMVNEKILTLPDRDGANPFEYQNDVLRLAADIDESCFTAQPVALVEYNNMTVSKNGFGNYTFRKTDSSKDSSAVYSYSGIDGSYLFGYASSVGGCCKDLVIKCDCTTIDSGSLIESYPIVFPMGNGQAGSTSTVQIKADEEKDSGNYKLMIYAMSEAVFKEAYEEFADEQLEITEFGDRNITGKINARKDGILLLSMPYEKGWSIYIDGREADTLCVMNALLGAKVSAGEHTIELVYFPEGLIAGTIITAASAVLTGFIIWCEQKRRRRKRLPAAAPESGDDLPPEEFSFTEINRSEIYNQDIEERHVPAGFCEEETDTANDEDTPEEKNAESENNNSI